MSRIFFQEDIRVIMGERIRARRKELKLTQTAFASKLADTQQKELSELSIKPEAVPEVRAKLQRTISDWENGNSPISNRDIWSICKVLNCDVSYLFGETPIDCPKKEIADVSKATGLSPQAVEFLQSNDYSDIVSAFITHPDFVGICERIRELQDKEALSKAQAKIWADGIWERASGKAFPKVIISDALFGGARTCFERILTDLVEEE